MCQIGRRKNKLFMTETISKQTTITQWKLGLTITFRNFSNILTYQNYYNMSQFYLFLFYSRLYNLFFHYLKAIILLLLFILTEFTTVQKNSIFYNNLFNIIYTRQGNYIMHELLEINCLTMVSILGVLR